MSHTEIIAVLQAHAAGKPLQCRAKNTSQTWRDVSDPQWGFDTIDYRVKPEPPKPREFWITRHFNGNDEVCSEGPSLTGVCDHSGCSIIHVREVLPDQA